MGFWDLISLHKVTKWDPILSRTYCTLDNRHDNYYKMIHRDSLPKDAVLRFDTNYVIGLIKIIQISFVVKQVPAPC